MFERKEKERKKERKKKERMKERKREKKIRKKINKADRHKWRARDTTSHYAKKSKVGPTDVKWDRPTDRHDDL